MKPEQFTKHLEEAAATVATWPKWKQNVLSDSLSQTVPVAREYVDNSLETQLAAALARADAAESRVNELVAEASKWKDIVDAHNLCHDLHGKVGPTEFAAGCAAEQLEIFGCSPDKDRADAAEARLATVYEECAKVVESTTIEECEYMCAPGYDLDDGWKTLQKAAESIRRLAARPATEETK